MSAPGGRRRRPSAHGYRPAGRDRRLLPPPAGRAWHLCRARPLVRDARSLFPPGLRLADGRRTGGRSRRHFCGAERIGTMDLAPLFARIEDADRGIRPQVIETPPDRRRMLSDTLGNDVWLKADQSQPTGTYKTRSENKNNPTLHTSKQAAGETTT